MIMGMTFVILPPTAPALRQPTRDQKRLIVAALEESYDTKNQRYKGTETDKGIADMLEDGIMAGWVAAVREDMFGPDGNEELGNPVQQMPPRVARGAGIPMRQHPLRPYRRVHTSNLSSPIERRLYRTLRQGPWRAERQLQPDYYWQVFVAVRVSNGTGDWH